uniref:Phosphate transport system permease protein PstA n=1 Tax=Candidatus Methanomethylicus mesodigestus TaxID=1867258 RepID=A0A7C3F098_9CREN
MPLLSRRMKDKMVKYVCLLLSAIAIVPLFWIISTVVINGISILSWEFLTSLPAPYGEVGGGIGNAIYGTLIINALASLWGIPVGVMTGIYLAEYDKDSRLGNVVRSIVESLAGVPSIVFGVFAYSLIVLTMRHYTAIAGAFALGLMMIPLVAKASEESMKVVSNDLREAAIALGIPKWLRTIKVVLSIAKGGVLTGSLLAFARISGETAPLLFTALFSFYWPYSIDQPMATLQVLIYNYAVSGFGNWVLKAWGASLILVMIVVSINIAVRYLTKKKYSGCE